MIKKKAPKKTVKKTVKKVKVSGGKKPAANEIKNLKVLAKAYFLIYKGLNIDSRNLKGEEKIGKAMFNLLEVIRQNGFSMDWKSGRLIKTIEGY